MANQDELISQYVDRASFQADTDFLSTRLKEVDDLFNKLNNYSIKLSGTKGFSDLKVVLKDAADAANVLTASQQKLIDIDLKAARAANELAIAIKAQAQAARERVAVPVTVESTNNLAAIAAEQSHVQATTGAVVSTADIAALQEQLAAQQALNVEANKSTAYRVQNNSATNQATVESEALAKAKEKLAISESKENIELQKYAVLNAEANKIAKAEAVQALGLTDAYGLLTNQYNDAQRNAKNMAAEFGVNSVQAKASAAEALALNTQLQAIDKTVGQSQKNVGNYSNAFTKAFSSLRQLAYILPGIGIAGLFNLAFEGIAALVERMNLFSSTEDKVREALNKGSDAAGKQVGQLQAYYSISQDVNASLSDRKKASDQVVDIVNKNNEVTGEHLKLLKNENGILGDNKIAIDAVSASLIKQAETQAFVTLIGEAYSKVIKDQTTGNLSFIDKLGAALRGFGDMSTFGEALSAVKSDKLKDDTKSLNELIAAFKKFQEAGKGEIIEPKSSISSKAEEQRLKDLEYYKERAADEKKLSTLTSLELETRLNARNEASITELVIAQREKANAIENANAKFAVSKKTASDEIELRNAISKAKQKAADELEKIERNYQRDIIDIEQSARGIRKDLDKKFNDETIAALADAEAKKKQVEANKLTTGDNYLQQNRDILLTSLIKETRDENLLLDKKHKDGLVSEEEYAKQRQLIQLRYRLTAQQINLQFDADEAKDKLATYDKELKALDLTEEKKAAILKDKAALEKQLALSLQALDDQLTQEKINNQQKLKDAQNKFIGEAESAFVSFFDYQYERQKINLQKQSDAIDRNTAKEIDAANATTNNAQQKAAAIAIIEARAQVQKDELARRQRQIDANQARTDKEVGLLKIAADTAASVVKLTAAAAGAKAEAALLLANPLTAAYAPIAAASAVSILAQIPFVIGAGALQAAVIAAKPIPAYKGGIHGDNSHPGGYAILGDGGRNEYVRMPDGSSFVTGSRPELHDLPKGTEVWPDASQMNDRLFYASMKKLPAILPRSAANNNEYLGKKLDNIAQIVKDKHELHIKSSGSGAFMAMHKYGDSWLQYIEQQTDL